MKPRVFQGGPREEIVVPKGDPDTKGDPLDCQGVQGLLGAPLISVRILTHLTSSQFLNIQYTITKYCWCHLVDTEQVERNISSCSVMIGKFRFLCIAPYVCSAQHMNKSVRKVSCNIAFFQMNRLLYNISMSETV